MLPTSKNIGPFSTPRISGAPFQPHLLARVAGRRGVALQPTNESSWKGTPEILGVENGLMFFTSRKLGCLGVPCI
jgi:hypothetical protein